MSYRVRTFKDEAALQDFMQGLELSDIKDLVSKGAQYTLIGEYSAEVVLRRYSNLTPQEEAALETFLDAEDAAGNLILYDEFYPLFLSDPADSLTGFFNKTATNNGMTKIAGGYQGDGVSAYINSNFNPKTAEYYDLNNGLAGAFIQDLPAWAGPRALFGRLNAASENTQITMTSPAPQITHGVNDITQPFAHLAAPDQYLITIRESSGTHELVSNGVKLGTTPVNSSGIPNGPILIGAIEHDTSGIAFYFNGSLSCFIIGAAIGFDHAAHYTNFTTLLTTLGFLP